MRNSRPLPLAFGVSPTLVLGASRLIDYQTIIKLSKGGLTSAKIQTGFELTKHGRWSGVGRSFFALTHFFFTKRPGRCRAFLSRIKFV